MKTPLLLLFSLPLVLQAAPQADGPPSDKENPFEQATVETSVPAHKDNIASHIIDGEMDTSFWSSRNVRSDETITLHMPEALPADTHLVIHTGLPDGRDPFPGAILERSEDGKVWTFSADERCGLLCTTLTEPTRHLRLRASKDVPHWVAIREVEISSAPPVRVIQGKGKVGEETVPISLACKLEGYQDLVPAFEKIGASYLSSWGRLVTLLGSPLKNTRADLDVLFVSDMDHPAHASGKTIVISAAHLRSNPKDTTGVFIHELTHIIQRYPVGQPSWFIEGSADYTRYLLNPKDPWAENCRRHIPYDKPFGAYWASAAFLFYLEETYEKPIVLPVSKSIRNRHYSAKIWKSLTGKSLEELAEDYKTSEWKPK